MPSETGRIPLAYFITFTTYGQWLHGDARKSVDREHNEFGTERLPSNPLLHAYRKRRLPHPPLKLSPTMIAAALAAIREVCTTRGWELVSANLRSNHVHVQVKAVAEAEKVLGDFKRYATRRLRREKLVDPTCPVWTDGGSTRYVWNHTSLNRIDRYIRKEQGENLGGRAEG